MGFYTMRIIAIDPGPHVGVAIRHDDDSYDVVMLHNELEDVFEIIMRVKPEVIVVERFATGGRMSGYGHRTVEIVGAMQALAYVLKAEFVKVSPQARYAFMEQSRKDLGRGRTQHEIDSYAHLLSWEYFNAK